jgi:hypothetical protein
METKQQSTSGLALRRKRESTYVILKLRRNALTLLLSKTFLQLRKLEQGIILVLLRLAIQIPRERGRFPRRRKYSNHPVAGSCRRRGSHVIGFVFPVSGTVSKETSTGIPLRKDSSPTRRNREINGFPQENTPHRKTHHTSQHLSNR